MDRFGSILLYQVISSSLLDLFVSGRDLLNQSGRVDLRAYICLGKIVDVKLPLSVYFLQACRN
jgi:hypothetical protein